MTRKRRIQGEPAESSKVPDKGSNPDVELNGKYTDDDLDSSGASTSKPSSHFLSNGDISAKDSTATRKLKYFKRRRLMESIDAQRESPYVTNWYARLAHDPNFASLSRDYPSAQTLFGYTYRGEREVDRLDRLFSGGAQTLKRTDAQIHEEVERHREVYEDLVRSQRMFEDRAKGDGRMAAMGLLVDRIGWRQLPSSVRRRLHEDAPKQSFLTAQMSNAEVQRLIGQHPLDWSDDHDVEHPPGRPIFYEFESAARYGITDPPLSCCIFTKHRNERISRCLREPMKAFHWQLAQKAARKGFPFYWDKKLQTPVICAFHHNVIEKEPKSTECNPFFERALGRHEESGCVRFTEDEQFEQIGDYINSLVHKEKEEHAEAMSFDFRLLKLFEPPKTLTPLQEVRSRQLFDTGISREGKSVELVDQLYERAAKQLEDLRIPPKCPYKNGEASSDDEDEDLADIAELPATLADWLPRVRAEIGPSAPLRNSFIEGPLSLSSANGDSRAAEDERLLYKACEFGLLEMNDSSSAEVTDRYRTLLDVQGFEDDTLRVFGSAKSNSIDVSQLNFEAISAASIRRIKKFYNLPNRSGATSKNLLLEGLNDYFINDPVDEHRIANEFIRSMTDRQKTKIADNKKLLAASSSSMPDTTNTKFSGRKPRQSKKMLIEAQTRTATTTVEEHIKSSLVMMEHHHQFLDMTVGNSIGSPTTSSANAVHLSNSKLGEPNALQNY